MEINDSLEYVTGDAFNIKFEVEGLDFTGMSVRSHFRKEINQTTPDLICLTSDGSIQVNIVSVTKSELTFIKTPAQMAALIPGTYQYDIEVYSTANDVQTICRGSLKVIKDITR
jgi:hypothetical protein